MGYRYRSRHAQPWYYDPSGTNSVGRPGRYELNPEQLANLEIVRKQRQDEARARRTRIRALWLVGYCASDIVILTGFSRCTVWRHLKVIRDPLLGDGATRATRPS